jgi:transcriptional regulator GlxA family with amidase domain
MTILIEAAHCVLIDDEEDARQYVLSAFDALRHAAGVRRESAGDVGLTEARQSFRGGLSGWQVRRLSLHIDKHLSEPLLCKELASLVNLSISHFIRAFKVSFGCSPHLYLIRRRLERAQGLMLTTDAPLGQIALDCGLADQAHLSRLFKQIVGDSPAAWRRARAVLSDACS